MDLVLASLTLHILIALTCSGVFVIAPWEGSSQTKKEVLTVFAWIWFWPLLGLCATVLFLWGWVRTFAALPWDTKENQ